MNYDIDGIYSGDWYMPSRGEMLYRSYYPLHLETKPQNRVWRKIFKFMGKFTLALLLVFSLIYSIMNAPVIYNKIRYAFNQQPQEPETAQAQALLGVVTETPTETPFVSDDPTLVKDGTLLIPKIGIEAPIIYADSSEESTILANLKSGVVHYPGTALPGEEGNVFITGHSSYYWWDDGKYNQVFSLLENMAVGDRIYVSYGGKRYIYAVTEKNVVNPQDVNVLTQAGKSRISLMTCVPVGTNLNRLVVVAEQIEPAPESNKDTAKDNLPAVEQLPGLDNQ